MPIKINPTTGKFDIVNSSPSIGGTITGGTTGSILFVNPTATIAQDNANFFYGNSTQQSFTDSSGVVRKANHVVNSDINDTTSQSFTNATEALVSSTGGGLVGARWSETYTLASNATNYSNLRGDSIFVRHRGSGTVTTVAGVVGQAEHRGTNTVSNLRGLSYSAINFSTGPVTNLIGAALDVENISTGVVTNSYNSYATFTNTGTVTNTYGYYVNDITSGTQTNTPFAFYNSDAGALTYFAGKTGINQTAPTGMLDIVAASSSTVGQIIKAAASQTADLFQVQNSSGTKLTYITSAGDIDMASGQFIRYNGQKLAYGITASSQFFFGKAGNPTLASMTGSNNNAFGDGALFSLTSGTENNAMGINSLLAVTTGTHNIGIGRDGGGGITTGSYNIGIGYRTLKATTVASNNTAIGRQAGENNTSGTGNAFYGYFAGNANTTGSENLAAGTTALQNNTTGSHNMALGYQALSSIVGSRNVAVGSIAWGIASTGDNNTAIGYNAGINATSGDKNIIIGHNINIPSASGSNQLNIGNIIFGTGVSGTGTTIAGLIGIGLTSPTAQLDIAASTTSNASLRLQAGTAPTSPNSGDVWNDSTQKTVQVYEAGVKQNVATTLFTQTATGTVTNTVTETAITSTGVGTLTLPANFFVAGKTINITGYGLHSSVGGSTINIRVKFGSTTICTTGAVTSGVDTDRSFWVDTMITCRTTGATGTVFGQGVYHEVGASPADFDMVNTTTTTIDTTASQAVSITAEWDTADAGNSISLTNLTVTVSN